MRVPIKFRCAFWLLLPAVLMILSGCVIPSPYRSSPDMGRFYQGVHTLVLARPDVTVYELTTGEGVSIERLGSLSQGSGIRDGTGRQWPWKM